MFHLSAHICKSKKLQILIFPPSRVSRVLKSGMIQEISQRGGAETFFFFIDLGLDATRVGPGDDFQSWDL